MNNSLPLKFGIGFFAGLCAALFPRVIAELATASNSDVITLFSWNYVVLSLVFASLIGVVIAILQWEVKSAPKDIFMSALAIPGLLSGALNTAASVKGLEQVETEMRLYENTLQQDFQIPTLEPSALVPISKLMLPASGDQRFGFAFISTAHAGEGEFHRVANHGIGVRKRAPEYVVVLQQAGSKEDAEAKAATLRSKTPVKIFRDKNKRYFVTTASGSQSKANALIEAVRLKKTKGLNAAIMENK